MICKFYLLLASIFVVTHRINADLIFTSPIRTKALFASVDQVIEKLEEYINTEEDRVKTLQGYLNDWEEEHKRLAENPDVHLANHISLFNYLKKLNLWWPYWHDETKKNSAASAIFYMKNSNTSWPTMEDMNGVMDSVINIQIIHDIKATSLVNGNFNGMSTKTKLDFEECLMMAERCFETVHYKLSLEWSLSALQKYFVQRIKNEEKLSKILYYISYTSYITGGDLDLAADSITTYVNKNPNDEKAKTLENVIHLRLPKEHEKSMSKKLEVFLKVKNLCNKFTTENELFRNPRSKCRYNFHNSYFLRIAPLKEELLSVNPKVILYREAMYDSEIHFLKEKSKERLQEKVTDKDSNLQYDQIEMAEFSNEDHHAIERISKRVDDMIASKIKSKNKFQLSKYNVGGSYVDYEERKRQENFGIYSTTIFHMNDVILGGSTILPELEIAIKAEKGTALVWFDKITRRSDDLTKYSSCPTLVGRKWTFTKQIFEKTKSKFDRKRS